MTFRVTAAQKADEDQSAGGPSRWAWWSIVVVVAFRLAYHLTYLGEMPFAAATFSDGQVYERAARDILDHPPLGSAPFYLQGAYAYFLAPGIAIDGLRAALLAQLALAGLSLGLLYVALRVLWTPRVAFWGLLLALLHPAWAFYENKFLSAQLAVFATVTMLAAVAWAYRRRSVTSMLACGAAVGLAILARPNFVLMVPFGGWALLRETGASDVRRKWRLLAYGLGLAIMLSPMAARNLAVTGHATVFPAHGGGTSFYIGNNSGATGVWNQAGIFSGDVSHEADEFGAADPTQLGRELYRRGLDEIIADPWRWVKLELKKLWLLVGNDELAQDYDVFGERELIPWAYPIGVPFAVILALAVIGAPRLFDATRRRARGCPWWLAGMALSTILANLVFFTSSQHRLPLTVALIPPAALGVETLRQGWHHLRRSRGWLAVGVAIALQGLWPRTHKHEPSAAHYYNLALAYEHTNEPALALAAVERAASIAAQDPVILIGRARLRRLQGDAHGARSDLATLSQIPGLPRWIRARAEAEAARLSENTRLP